MIPFGTETVTLIRRTETVDENGKTRVSYATETLRGCSWRRTRRDQLYDSQLLPVETITCRVPAGQAVPKAGDLLILGEVSVSVESWSDYQQIIESCKDTGGAFTAASVADNTRPGMPMPHWTVRS